MKKCICDRNPTPEDNSNISPDYQAKYHTIRHRIACACGIKTKFYATLAQAKIAWDNKGWVNRRRVA